MLTMTDPLSCRTQTRLWATLPEEWECERVAHCVEVNVRNARQKCLPAKNQRPEALSEQREVRIRTCFDPESAPQKSKVYIVRSVSWQVDVESLPSAFKYLFSGGINISGVYHTTNVVISTTNEINQQISVCRISSTYCNERMNK